MTYLRGSLNYADKNKMFFLSLSFFFKAINLFSNTKANTKFSFSAANSRRSSCFIFPSFSLCADLPPPPEPPPEEDRLQGPQGCTEANCAGSGSLSSLERSEYSSSSHQRKGSGQRHADSKTDSCIVSYITPGLVHHSFHTPVCFLLPDLSHG